MIEVDLHSHTIHSFCGNSTPLEMLSYALKLNLRALAITDHAPALGRRVTSTFYQRFKNPYPEILLLKGMECNILMEKGEIDLPLNLYPFMDLVIAGFHSECHPKDLGQAHYTEFLIAAIENNPINIISHPTDPNISLDFSQIVKCAKKNNTALELNNSKIVLNSFNLDAAKNMLKLCKEEKCPIAVNSDAHTVTEIADVKEAFKLLDNLKFPHELIINKTLESALSFLNLKKS